MEEVKEVSGVEAGRAGRLTAACAAGFGENGEGENEVAEGIIEGAAAGKGDGVKGDDAACTGAEFCPCWKGLG